MASANYAPQNQFQTATPERGELHPGLTPMPRSQWPQLQVQPYQRPIDQLKPGQELHNRVLDYLVTRIRDSERAMSAFHGRWRCNEMRNQAWIDLRKYDKVLKQMNDSGKPPLAVDIVVPYSFATLSTISTYLLQVFAAKMPYMQVGTYGTNVNNAMQMEVLLQYQNDHNRIVKWWWNWFNDMNLYGVGILSNRWLVKTQQRTQRQDRPVFDLQTGNFSQESIREQNEVVTYEGNDVFSVDPFMFYPDPRVPMREAPEKAEYIDLRSFEGKHMLKRQEQQGLLKWVDAAPAISSEKTTGTLSSARDLLTGGDAHAGANWHGVQEVGPGAYDRDNISIDIVPRELGIGESDRIERWSFSILNKAQIVAAERLLDDHGEHPVIVAEPYGSGYDFGSAGMADYVGPLQDSMSWFLNSHMQNVRSSINNQFVVDPFAVEMKDVNRPGPGRTIRMKRTALNRDVKSAIMQLPVQDITRGHMTDMNTFFEIGQRVSAVSENLLGLQDSGGRKTATEVRTSGAAAASRLAALTRVVSAQGMTSLANQMALNSMQWMTKEFHVRVTGSDGMQYPLQINPDGVAGDYYYPVNDGSLPMDKVALMDIWKEIIGVAFQDPEIRANYSIPKIFEFVAELGGAKNIKSFKIQQGSPEQIQQQQQQGNHAPIPGATGPSGLTNATLPQPRQRLQGGQ
jgi:hypothetical protein